VVVTRVGEGQEEAASAILGQSDAHRDEASDGFSDEEIPLADEAREDARIRNGIDPVAAPNFPR
jgi:hypothetical protein